MLSALQKRLIAALLPLALSACLGAPVARQLASSAFMQAADKVAEHAVNHQEKPTQAAQASPQAEQDAAYWAVFARMQLPDEQPQAIVEPLPQHPAEEPVATTHRLVTVEVWGFVVGPEKEAVLQRMQTLGGQNVTDINEEKRWPLATGAIPGHRNRQLFFLVPPTLGQISSGDHTLVEIAGTGGVHIARYRMEN